jgi:DNA repair exonuclease SbcCD nuclease subunit
MTKFLHIADVHLGIRRYRLEDRTRDFFYAWRDCIERYALRERVSFVLIVGDLFDVRRVEPQAMNHAMYCLVKLRDAGIPVITIEGNHDQREKTHEFSWLRSLSQWGFIKLLEPFYEEGGVVRLEPWDEEARTGSYIDLGGVRIFGSTWYGSTVSHILPALVEQVERHRSEQRYHVMMLHTDVEGQINRPIPALSLAKINELKSVVDYLALGHTHKNFEIDGWVYNPGSLEACTVDEYANQRGAYLVEVAGGHHTARLVQDYYQRPIVRLNFDVSGRPDPEELRRELFAQLRREVTPHDPDETDAPAPIIELSLRGHLGFKSALLAVNRIRDEIKKEFRPLSSIVRDQTVPVEYAVAAGLAEHVTRAERERRVIEDLIARDARFRDRAVAMADLILEVKRLALGDEQPARITEMIEQRLNETQQAQVAGVRE